MALSQDEFFSDEFFKQFPELASQVTEMGSDLFPVDTLSNEEISRRNQLTNQAQRLSPLERPAMQGSNRIRGNPHSIDTSSMNNAIQQGLVKLLNANRERKLLGKGDDPGIMGELQTLETKAQEAREQQEKQDEFLARTMPDVVDRLMQTEQSLKTEDAKAENRMDLENTRFTNDMSMEEFRSAARTDLQKLRGTQQQDLARLRSELAVERDKAGGGSGGSGDDGIPTSVITNFANMGRQAGNTLFGQVDAMDERLNNPGARGLLRNEAIQQGEDPAEYIEKFQKERDRKYELAWRMMALGGRAAQQGGMPEELINEYESMLEEVTSGQPLDENWDDL